MQPPIAPPVHSASRQLAARRVLAFLLATLASSAHAQAMGQGLVSYMTPIILFLGGCAVVTALVSAVVKPELVTRALWIAVILVVVFFVLKNLGSLQAAVQQ